MANRFLPPPPGKPERLLGFSRWEGKRSRAAAAFLGIALLIAGCAMMGEVHPAWLGLAAGALMAGLAFAVSARRAEEVDPITGWALFDIVPCYISIQDPELRIVRSNALFRREFGDRTGRHCYEVYKGRNEACPDCPVEKTFRDGTSHSREETVIRADGSRADMIVYSSPLLNRRGKITHVMEMMTDITEVKRLQREVDIRRKEYQRLFDKVPCYLSVQDRDLRILETNALFKKDFGDVKGEYCFRVYKGRDTICPDCPAAKSLSDGRSHSSEETVITRDGRPAHMIVYTMPLVNDAGEIDRVMEMSTNITEVKRLQQELTATGRAVAGMAHRIKNILMGLEGGIFVVNTGMETGEEATVKEGWEMIERNVAKVSRIVKDMLYCSKTREPSFQDVSPVEIVREVYELFRKRAGETEIELRLELPDEDYKGRFDPESLHSLVINLVTNAMDACKFDLTEGKDRHEIVVRCARDEEGRTVIEVADNGAGIPEGARSRIFEDFFSTKGNEGTGLGLLVARKVVEEHGGEITFETEEGKGTTFRAVFPAHSPEGAR